MKQILLFVAFLMLASGATAQRFSAVSPYGDTLYYTITSDTTVELTPKCELDTTTGVPPLTLYFARNPYLHDSLIIPESTMYNGNTYTVTSIGFGALTAIYGGIFYGDSIYHITLPNTIRVLKSVSVAGLRHLKTINIPETIDTIEWEAFGQDYDLSVDLPSSVSYVANWAFFEVHNVNYYGNLDPNAEGLAWECENWNDCNTNTGLKMSNDTLYKTNRMFSYFSIPEEITHIEAYAFYNNSSLSSIIIPNSVRYIGEESFSLCTALNSIVLPDSLTEICSELFSNCTSLTNVTLPLGLKHIDYWAFNRCFSLSNLSIPNSVVTLGYGTFNKCSSLITLRLPDSLATLPGDLLRDCSGLQSVHIGPLVTSINSQAFAGCTGLDSIYIDCIVPPTLGDNVFYDVPLNNVVLIVPCGTGNTYRNANGWSSFSNIIETECPRGTVLVFANDSALGAVSGSGTYLLGDTVTIAAFPTTHTYFNGWSNGVTDNPYTLIVQTDTTLTAMFLPADTTYIDVHDTTYVDVHDTTYIDVHDTTYVDVFVHDTTYIDVHDTTYVDVFVHDTTYVDVFVHDTTYIDVPYPVHDTTYVNVHDTTYVPVHDTTYVNVPYPVHDTTYINVPYPVHDTTYVNVPYPVHDTTYVNVPYPVHDTTVVTDTLWLTQYDTIWLHDTIIIHDTIYITQEGIGGAETVNAKVYSSHGQIVVEGATGNTVTLYDVSGRMLATKRDDGTLLHFDVPSSGTYMIKIGDVPARKVVVIR